MFEYITKMVAKILNYLNVNYIWNIYFLNNYFHNKLDYVCIIM